MSTTIGSGLGFTEPSMETRRGLIKGVEFLTSGNWVQSSSAGIEIALCSTELDCGGSTGLRRYRVAVLDTEIQ